MKIIILMLVFVSGCAWTPEQRQAFGQALQKASQTQIYPEKTYTDCTRDALGYHCTSETR